MLATPFTPLVHRVENGCVAKPGKWDFTRRFDLVDDGTLINKPKIKVQYIVADEEVCLGDSNRERPNIQAVETNRR